MHIALTNSGWLTRTLHYLPPATNGTTYLYGLVNGGLGHHELTDPGGQPILHTHHLRGTSQRVSQTLLVALACTDTVAVTWVRHCYLAQPIPKSDCHLIVTV